MRKFIPLKDLVVYQLSRELSKIGWEIYESLDWRDKKIMGDQFIEATDSAGANIAEGYFRYHFLERIKFYYNSRGSLAESTEHWLKLLKE
jgi:four helix bundle protein